MGMDGGDDEAPRQHPREEALGSVKGRGVREGVRVPAPREALGAENPPGSHSGFALRVRVPCSALSEQHKQPFPSHSAHA